MDKWKKIIAKTKHKWTHESLWSHHKTQCRAWLLSAFYMKKKQTNKLCVLCDDIHIWLNWSYYKLSRARVFVGEWVCLRATEYCKLSNCSQPNQNNDKTNRKKTIFFFILNVCLLPFKLLQQQQWRKKVCVMKITECTYLRHYFVNEPNWTHSNKSLAHSS